MKRITISFLQEFKKDVDRDKLLNCSKQYNLNNFTSKSLHQFTEKELFDFLINKKFNEFTIFINGFMEHISFDSKINSLINLNILSLKKNMYGVKFFFEIQNSNSKKYTTEVREIQYLVEEFENFCHYNSDKNNDYCINTNYNELFISFYPSW